MKFFKFQIQDYMDMYPETEVRIFDSMEDATRFEVQMNSNYSGGITKCLGEMDSEEAANYVRHLYNVEKKHKREDSHDFLLNVAIKYKECYGKEVISAQELTEF